MRIKNLSKVRIGKTPYTRTSIYNIQTGEKMGEATALVPIFEIEKGFSFLKDIVDRKNPLEVKNQIKEFNIGSDYVEVDLRLCKSSGISYVDSISDESRPIPTFFLCIKKGNYFSCKNNINPNMARLGGMGAVGYGTFEIAKIGEYEKIIKIKKNIEKIMSKGFTKRESLFIAKSNIQNVDELLDLAIEWSTFYIDWAVLFSASNKEFKSWLGEELNLKLGRKQDFAKLMHLINSLQPTLWS